MDTWASRAEKFEQYRQEARRVALLYTRNPSDVDDIVSVAFMKVWDAEGRGKGPGGDGHYLAYLNTCVRHEVIDRAQRTERERRTLTKCANSCSAGSDGLARIFELGDAIHLRAALSAAFDKLNDRHKQVLTLTVIDQKSPTEAGSVLGLKPNAVCALSYRARTQLRRNFARERAAACARTGWHLGTDHLLRATAEHGERTQRSA